MRRYYENIRGTGKKKNKKRSRTKRTAKADTIRGVWRLAIKKEVELWKKK